MELSKALICINCDNIFSCDKRQCPNCGSNQQLIPISKWLLPIEQPTLYKNNDELKKGQL